MPSPIIAVKLDADLLANQQIIPFDVSQETLITASLKRRIPRIYVVKGIHFKLIAQEKSHPPSKKLPGLTVGPILGQS